MLSETIPFDRLWKRLHRSSLPARSVASFVRFIERRLGGRFVYETSQIPYARPDLADVFKIADTLQRAGVIESYSPVFGFYDEPHRYGWRAQGLGRSRETSGGMSASSDTDALLAALAEGLERLLWKEEVDYFRSPLVMSVAAMQQSKNRGKNVILPDRFVGITNEQRLHDADLTLSKDDEYLWIKGFSLIQRGEVFLPAQMASGAYHKFPLLEGKKEKIIRIPITTGLATWPTRDGAILGGALEVIERDAYMIMWLNQLTLPRIDLAPFRTADKELDTLIVDCERYRLRVHAVRLVTDAPADVVCVVVEDMTEHGPRFSVGLKAHRDINRCIEGALMEALRSRQNARGYREEEAQRYRKSPPRRSGTWSAFPTGLILSGPKSSPSSSRARSRALRHRLG